VIACSASFCATHHQVGELVDDEHDVGHVRGVRSSSGSWPALAQLLLAERL
jgi:hypothetical protein